MQLSKMNWRGVLASLSLVALLGVSAAHFATAQTPSKPAAPAAAPAAPAAPGQHPALNQNQLPPALRQQLQGNQRRGRMDFGWRRSMRGWNDFVSAMSLKPTQATKIKPAFDKLAKAEDARKASFKAKVQTILTPDQRKQMDAMRHPQPQASGSPARPAMRPGIQLTQDQQAKMRTLRMASMTAGQTNREQFIAKVSPMLDADQKTHLSRMMLRRRANHTGMHALSNGKPATAPAAPAAPTAPAKH